MQLKSLSWLMPLGLSVSLITGCSSTPSLHANNAAIQAGAPGLPSNAVGLLAQGGAQEYRIGPSDLLDIKVFQADELSREVRVDAQGNISLPLLGNVAAAGLTQMELEKKLASLMSKNLLQNPQVSIFLKEQTAQRVTVEGEVTKPGVYPLAGSMTVLQSIAQAQGLTVLASADKVMLLRSTNGQAQAYLVNVDAIRKGLAPDPYVRNDDRIVVQRSDGRFWAREAGTWLSPLAGISTLKTLGL